MAPPKQQSENGWDQWQKHVLMELKRHSGWCEDLNDKLDALAVDVAGLKVKAGVWGLVGGSISVLILVGLLLARGILGIG